METLLSHQNQNQIIHKSSTDLKSNKNTSKNPILKTLICSASKNLELFCQTLSNAKEKYKSEADGFLAFIKKNEENINKLISDKTKYYNSMRDKVNDVIKSEKLIENLSLNEDTELHQIVDECNNYSIFYKNIKAIQDEISNLKILKENKSLKEYLENAKALLDIEAQNINTSKISNLMEIENFENISFANNNTSVNEDLEKDKVKSDLKNENQASIKNNKNNNNQKNSNTFTSKNKNNHNEEKSSESSESEKVANKYLKYETPSSNKFLSKKRLKLSDGDIESTNTNNQDEIDLIKDSEEISSNEEDKKINEVTKDDKYSNNISKDSLNTKKNYKNSMKRELNGLGLSSKIAAALLTKKNILNSNNNTNNTNNTNNNPNKIMNGSSNETSNKENNSFKNKEKDKDKDREKDKQDITSQITLNSVYSDTIDLISSTNPNLNNCSNINNPAKKYETKNETKNDIKNNIKNEGNSAAATNGTSNNKFKSKPKNSGTAVAANAENKIKNQTSEPNINQKEEIQITNSSNIKTNNNNQNNCVKHKPDNLHPDNPLIKSPKFIEISNELRRNMESLSLLVKKDHNNFSEFINENFEECLFKQRIFYCEFDMLNKHKKLTSDLLGKDQIFENSENYEFVKLTIVRKGKQNINNLLKSMENFFKQYIKRKDIDGSAVIKGTLNGSFEKLQKYFTLQMRSFEYCEAIQLEVYLFKWDLFYDYNDKEDKTNLDNNLTKQYVNYGNMLRETRILAKKKNLMVQASSMDATGINVNN